MESEEREDDGGAERRELPERRELRAVGALSRELLAKHAAATRLDTLEEIIRARWNVVDIVVQDEFTHDVIVEGHPPAFLVFDTT